MPDTAEAVGQDNREPGENPGRSRRCVSGAFFQPKGSHCENGKTKKCDEAKVRRPAFLLGIIGSAMDGHLYILSEFGLFDRREIACREALWLRFVCVTLVYSQKL